MLRATFLFFTFSALALACGDDSTGDAGPDATTSDAATDAAADAPAEAAASDAAPDGASDASADAPGDAPGVDASTVDASSCDAGCKLFSYECSGGQFPACTCLALPGDQPDPTCDAGTVSCFVDPCQGKTAACNAGQCHVK